MTQHEKDNKAALHYESCLAAIQQCNKPTRGGKLYENLEAELPLAFAEYKDNDINDAWAWPSKSRPLSKDVQRYCRVLQQIALSGGVVSWLQR